MKKEMQKSASFWDIWDKPAYTKTVLENFINKNETFYKSSVAHTSVAAISLWDAWKKFLANFWANLFYWNIINF